MHCIHLLVWSYFNTIVMIQVLRDLEVKVHTLKVEEERLTQEEARLTQACQERERQQNPLQSDFHIEERFREVCIICMYSRTSDNRHSE